MLEMIASFLRYTGIKADTFGRLTVNDPNLISKMQHGGQLTDDAEMRILRFMQRYEDSKE